MSTNYTTVIEAVQAPEFVITPWIVGEQFVVEGASVATGNKAAMMDLNRDGTRSSDGRWLKQDVSLNSPVVKFSAEKQAIADMYGEDVEFLFFGETVRKSK